MANRVETTPIPARCGAEDSLHMGYLFYDEKMNLILCSRHKKMLEENTPGFGETIAFEWVLLA